MCILFFETVRRFRGWKHLSDFVYILLHGCGLALMNGVLCAWGCTVRALFFPPLVVLESLKASPVCSSLRAPAGAPASNGQTVGAPFGPSCSCYHVSGLRWYLPGLLLCLFLEARSSVFNFYK